MTVLTTISPTTITWRGLTLYGTAGAGQFTFSTMDGWADLPDPRHGEIERPQQHGVFDEPVYSAARHVLVTAWRTSMEERDVELAALKAVFNFAPTSLSPLVIDHAGMVLTSDARLLRFKPTWGNGFWGWAAEWVCPDPLRYGTAVTATTGFPVAGGGLAFPLYTNRTVREGGLWFGARNTTGRIVLTNSGDTDAWVDYTLDGPLDVAGCEVAVVGSGSLHQFQGGIPAGSTVLVEGATGMVLMDGYSDRSGQMTRMDPIVVPAGGTIGLALIPLGSTSAAQLTASLTPGRW
jgi:hypothetical protein